MKEKARKILENFEWIALFCVIIIFLIILKNVKDEDIVVLDNFGYQLISNHLISDSITPFVKIITNFAGMMWLIALSGILVFSIKNRKIGISIFINLCLSALTNYVIKQIIQRPRPLEEYRLIYESGYSLPSGHSMVSMAFYGYLIYLIQKRFKNTYIKIFLTIMLSMLIVNIGISRIYLGVHYTSDVLAGFLVGIAYLIVYVSILKKIFLCSTNRLGYEKCKLLK